LIGDDRGEEKTTNLAIMPRKKRKGKIKKIYTKILALSQTGSKKYSEVPRKAALNHSSKREEKSGVVQ